MKYKTRKLSNAIRFLSQGLTANISLIHTYFIGGLKISSHDSSLVLKHREEEVEADDIELLVSEVKAAIRWDITKQVHGPRYSTQQSYKD